MTECTNIETQGHGSFIRCGEPEYGKDAPIWYCRDCLMGMLLWWIEHTATVRAVFQDILWVNDDGTWQTEPIIDGDTLGAIQKARGMG